MLLCSSPYGKSLTISLLFISTTRSTNYSHSFLLAKISSLSLSPATKRNTKRISVFDSHSPFPTKPRSSLFLTSSSSSTGKDYNNRRVTMKSTSGIVEESEADMDKNQHLQTQQPGRIIVVGSSNQDLTSYTNLIPKLGETVMGQRFEVSPGGKGANQAIAAAKILPSISSSEAEQSQTSHDDKVHIITRVGNDAFAKLLLQNFDQSNVKYDQTSIISNDAHTGVAPIMVDQKTGDNMIVVVPGANNLLTSDMVREELYAIKDSIKDRSKVVILSQLEVPLESTIEAMKIGKEWGAITILNPAPFNKQILENDVLKYVDIIIPNETELRQLIGVEEIGDSDGHSGSGEENLAKKLFGKGIQKAVIVTLGERGAMIVTPNTNNDDFDVNFVNAPSELVCNSEPVVDTVGAGDCFCGSLSVYLSAGFGLSDAATKACGVASMSVRRSGAQTSYPSFSDLPTILKLEENTNKSCKSSPARKILTFVTGNKKKLEEVQQILIGGDDEDLPFEITNQKIDLPELQGDDPIVIAIEKCKLAAREINGPVFTEDTSLCFHALNGLPGPYIKWFLEKCGHDGLNRMLDGFKDKSAYAQTIVAFTWGSGQDVHVFDGRTDGSIVQPRGALDFGWDPIFQPKEGNGMTYAEMTKGEKNKISHRGKSFAKFHSYLTSFENS